MIDQPDKIRTTEAMNHLLRMNLSSRSSKMTVSNATDKPSVNDVGETCDPKSSS